MTATPEAHPAVESPADTNTRPLPPGGPELIAAAGLGDVHYLLDLGVPLPEIARRMFIRETALAEALKLAENQDHVD